MPSRRSKRTTRHSERMSRHGVRCPAPPRSLPKSRKSIRRRFFNEPKHEGWKIRRHEKQDARFAEHKPELSEIQLSNRLIMNKKSLICTISQELDPPVSQDRIARILDKGQFLQSKDGTRFISASSLSSALSAARNNKTSVAYGIKRVIKELKL